MRFDATSSRGSGPATREAGIIYCIRRKDVDALTASSTSWDKVASLSRRYGDHGARATQDALRRTVQSDCCHRGFRMGIDRSNIRFIIMRPCRNRSEHYQQETGRAAATAWRPMPFSSIRRRFHALEGGYRKIGAGSGRSSGFWPTPSGIYGTWDRFCRFAHAGTGP